MNTVFIDWLKATSALWLALGLSGATCVTQTGCEGGLPLMAQANPQTKMDIDPLTKHFYVFSNDGKTFNVTNAKFSKGADGSATFSADQLSVSDRSVENRTANVEQIKAGAEQIKALGDVMIGCAAEIRKILNPASGVIDSLGDAAPKLAEIAERLESSATTQPAPTG